MQLSVQLFTLRDDCQRDLEGTLSRLSEMGLRFVECAGLNDRSPEEFRDLLDQYQLRAMAGHEGLDTVESQLQMLIHRYKVLGANHIVVPWIGRDTFSQGWKHVANRLNELGKQVNDAGFQLGYHNHDFEFELEDGKPGFLILLDHLDPALVKVQLDVYWVKHAGFDPAKIILDYPDHIRLLHLKDGDGQPSPRFLVAGEGVVDWDSVLSAAEKTNPEFGSIELDHCERAPLDMVSECYRFFAKHGLQ